MKNVTIYKSSLVSEITYSKKKIKTLKINNKILKNIKYLISSTSLPQLGKLLSLNIENLKFDKGPKTVLVNLLIDKPINMGDLSYFYCYDKNFKTLRVDNYFNYCGNGAIRKGLYPITMEMLIKENELSKDEIKLQAIQELKHFNVLKTNTNIKFIEVEILDAGFPLLTQVNVDSINQIRNKIESLNLDNLIKVGILSEVGLFFEGDIKVDIYEKMNKIIRM